MARVTAAPPAAMRVILCLRFDHGAAFDEVMRFKRQMIDSAEVLHAIESDGDFDFIVELEVSDFGELQSVLSRLGSAYDRLVHSHKASVVCRRHVPLASHAERWLWVTCGDQRRRIDIDRVDRIVAEGDYVRLHCGPDSFLLHATMNAIEGSLASHQFVRIHRSAILRRSLVERLVHRDHYWVACLVDGSEYRISRSHLADTLAAFNNDWTTALVDSASRSTLGRPLKAMRLNHVAPATPRLQ